MPEHRERQTEAPVDPVLLGRRLRSVRVLHGYSRMTDLAAAINETCGFEVSARTLYAIERGEQLPSLDQLSCLAAVLAPEWNDAAVMSAVREDIRERIVLSGTDRRRN